MNLATSVTALSILAGILASAASAQPSAGVIPGHADTGTRSKEQQAVQSCAEAMLGRIVPADHWKVRVVDSPSQAQVPDIGSSSVMRLTDLSLTATAVPTDRIVAHAFCTVDASSRVVRIRVQIADEATVAGLKSSDLRLVANAN